MRTIILSLLVLCAFSCNYASAFIGVGSSPTFVSVTGKLDAVFSPVSVDGLKMWMDAADHETITHDGFKVSAWDDKSTQNLTCTQSDDTRRPETNMRTLNGLNVIDSDDDSLLDCGDVGFDPSADDLTIFIVYSIDDWATFGTSFSFGGDRLRFVHASNGNGFVLGASNNIGQQTSDARVANITMLKTAPDGVVSARFNKVDDFSGDYNDMASSSNLTLLSNTNTSTGFSLDGYIAEMIVYDRTLSASEVDDVEAYLDDKWRVTTSPSQIAVALSGQSNMRAWDINWCGTSPTNGGSAAFISALEADSTISDAEVLAGYTNGSSLIKSNVPSSQPNDWWYDPDTGSFGAPYSTFLSAVNGAANDVELIVWDQGISDSDDLGLNQNFHYPLKIAEYKAGLKTLFSKMRSDVGDVPIIISPFGSMTSDRSGNQALRDIQREVARELDYVYLTVEKAHQGRCDGLHISDAGVVDHAGDVGNHAKWLLGKTQVDGVLGAEIKSVSRTGMTVTIDLEPDRTGVVAGTDFTPTTGIEGFEYWDTGYDGFGETGTEISITSAVRTDADTITIMLSSLPSGSSEYLIYLAKGAAGLTYTNLVIDNSAETLPLRGTVWKDAGSGYARVN